MESDHQPLEAIMKKSLNEAPARLQRMMLNLQDYDIVVSTSQVKNYTLPTRYPEPICRVTRKKIC